MGIMSISIYMKGYYEEFRGFGLRKNKANLPAFGRKSKILSPKSDNSDGVAGRLLPRVDRETS